MCGSLSWAIHGYYPVLLSDDPKTLAVGGPSLPCAVVLCTVCGNMVLVNLLVAGVLSVVATAAVQDPKSGGSGDG